jgi:hypothetical protein
MRTRFAASAGVVASLTLGLAAAAALPDPAARADQVFHTAHFPLHPVGSEPLRSGFVEDAHANGPTIVAQEQYVLDGAQPVTAYQVTLNIFVRDPTYEGSAGVVFPTAIITTDAAGNGSGDAFFLPSGVPAVLRNATHGFIYTVSDSSGVRYSSGCVVVTLD